METKRTSRDFVFEQAPPQWAQKVVAAVQRELRHESGVLRQTWETADDGQRIPVLKLRCRISDEKNASELRSFRDRLRACLYEEGLSLDGGIRPDGTFTVDVCRAVFKDDVGEDAFRTHLKGEPPIAPVEWQALELLVRADEALARAPNLGLDA